jgi:hypothetical protein
MTRQQLEQLRDCVEEQMRWAVLHGGDQELLDLLRVESDRLSVLIGQCNSPSRSPNNSVGWLPAMDTPSRPPDASRDQTGIAEAKTAGIYKGLPAAASAALVRLEIISASSSATLAICRKRNRPVGPSIFGKSQNRTSTPASSNCDRKCAERVSRSTLATMSGTRCSRAAASAFSNSGRSRRLPDSASEFSDKVPASAVEITFDGRLLRFNAKPALALLCRRNPVVGNETAVMFVRHE